MERQCDGTRATPYGGNPAPARLVTTSGSIGLRCWGGEPVHIEAISRSDWRSDVPAKNNYDEWPPPAGRGPQACTPARCRGGTPSVTFNARMH
jgi:hypothetical protein